MGRIAQNQTDEARTSYAVGVSERLDRVIRLILQARPELNQTQIARSLGIDPGDLSKYRSGRRTPSLANMIRFCDEWGVSLDYLYRDRLGRAMDGALELHLLAERRGAIPAWPAEAAAASVSASVEAVVPASVKRPKAKAGA